MRLETKLSKLRLPFWLPLVALLLTGCVRLTPYPEARQHPDAGRFLEMDGHTVHVEVLEPTTDAPGLPILLVHGYGGSTYSWRKIAARLAESRRVVAVDLYGFGLTERPRERQAYSRTSQVALLRGVLEALDIQSAHVAGHSYGGGLAMTLAHRHPETVSSLILLDSTAPDWSTRTRRRSAAIAPLSHFVIRTLALRRSNIKRALARSHHDPSSTLTPEDIEGYAERLRVHGATRAYRALARPQNGPDDQRPVPLDEIRQPTLTIWGEEDRLIDVEAGRAATELLPDGRFVALPGCGHSPMEEKPDETLSAIEEFLATLKG